MAVRRSRNGTVRSILLSGENSDYCLSVMDVFSRSTGKTRLEVEKELKLVELKSQNPKILRGIATIMFRISRLERPSHLDPVAVRNSIFSRTKNPAVTMEERRMIMKSVAEEMHTTESDIDSAMYADNENNEILSSVPDVDPEKLAKMYNVEQIETVILKSLWIDIRTSTNMGRFVRRIRSLGLLYSESNDGGMHVFRISGPVSILEQSERYGSRLALLVRYILRFSDWELDASVKLKNGKEKEEFMYHLDSSVSEYTGMEGQHHEDLPSFVFSDPTPLQAGKNTVYPDYSLALGSATVDVFLTTPKYYAEDLQELKTVQNPEADTQLICIVGKSEKCPQGAFCFKESVDWYALRDRLSQRVKEAVQGSHKDQNVENNALKPKTKPTTDLEKVGDHLRALYPDTEAMTDYLEFMDLPVAETLENIGFKVRWKGLRIVITDD